MQHRFVLFFYYLFFSFVLLELKPFVLKGKVLGENYEKVWKFVKKCENSETILPFSCCPLVFLWIFEFCVFSVSFFVCFPFSLSGFSRYLSIHLSTYMPLLQRGMLPMRFRERTIKSTEGPKSEGKVVQNEGKPPDLACFAPSSAHVPEPCLWPIWLTFSSAKRGTQH